MRESVGFQSGVYGVKIEIIRIQSSLNILPNFE